MEERAGGAVEEGESLTVVGRMLEPGEPAPDFTLDHFDGSTMSSVTLGELAGSTVVLNVVNSVDTPVCDIQTRKIDGLFPDGQGVHRQHGPPVRPGRGGPRRPA